MASWAGGLVASWAEGLPLTLCEILEPAGTSVGTCPGHGFPAGRDVESAIYPVYIFPFLLGFEDVASNLFWATVLH